MTVVDLTLKRLDRLEKSMRDLTVRADARFGRLEGALDQIVGILEAHSRHFERMEEALVTVVERVDGVSARIDRLATAIARGRTHDLARFESYERRLRVIERKRAPK
jgi:hypothetical protein